MRKPLILGILLILALGSQAQRADLDKFSFTARYRNLPRSPLDSAYTTYSVDIETGQVMRALGHQQDVANRLVIEGWKQIPYDAHVQIQLVMEDVLVEGTEIVSRTYPIKDKDGKQIGERKAFRNQVRYSYASRWRMTDYKGNTLHQVVITTRQQKHTHQSAEYNSEAEAKAYTLFGFLGLMNQLNQQVLNQTIQNLGQWLSNEYGYTESYVSDFLWILNKRKHPEHEGFHRAWISFRQALMVMTPEQPLDDVRARMQSSIDFFNRVKKRYAGSTDKQDRKILFAASFNLSKIYYYLDEPEKAMAEAGEVVMNGYDAREGYRLQQWAESLQQQFSVSGIHTRHFPRDEAQFRGPVISTSSK